MLANTNSFTVSSPDLKLTPFRIQDFVIPGVTFNHPEIKVQGGRFYTSSDFAEFESLSFDVLLDENFCTYFELQEYGLKAINPYSNTFEDKSFTLDIHVMKEGCPFITVRFNGCRISSIGSINLESLGEKGEKLSVGLVYNFYEILKS